VIDIIQKSDMDAGKSHESVWNPPLRTEVGLTTEPNVQDHNVTENGRRNPAPAWSIDFLRPGDKTIRVKTRINHWTFFNRSIE
jgi:hypothetical protein